MAILKQPYEFAKATFWPFMNMRAGLGLALWYILGLIVLMGVFGGTLYLTGAFNDLQPGVSKPLSRAMIALTLVLYVLIWVLYASYITAFHRRAIYNERRGIFPLRFGKTEFHVMMVQFVWFLAFIATFIVAYLVTILVGFLFVGLTLNDSNAGIIGIILSSIFTLGIFVGYLYFMARMGATTALTVANGKFTFIETFAATKGRGWWMCLSYIVGITAYLVLYFALVLAIISLMGLSLGDINNPNGPSPEHIENILSSPMGAIGLFVVYPLFIILITLVMQMFPGISSYIVKTYKGSNIEVISDLYA